MTLQLMSNGEIAVEMFYSSSVVKSVETFDAAATGILDCDMTGGGYQTGKNPAFQFAGDLLGGYSKPIPTNELGCYYGGGLKDALNDLYTMVMTCSLLVGGSPVQEISGILPSPMDRTAADFKDWKFRSPPGLATKVFEKPWVPSPIVMDFTEIFTALETGIIDGADACKPDKQRWFGSV